MDRGPESLPMSNIGDSLVRVVVRPLDDLVDDCEDPPTEDSLDFFLRDFLGTSGLAGDELSRSAVWPDVLEAPSAKSLA